MFTNRRIPQLREIILDTETTGLDPQQGHRIIEIGCLEMINLRLTNRSFHTYINPEREVPLEATQISGITTDFLKSFPVFQQISEDFLFFVKDSTLVIHNARFDIGFLNAELTRLQYPLLTHPIVDTLSLARKLFPGSPASLDALCKRFQVDLTARTKHGALLDAQLLAKIYIELQGGRQRKIFLGSEESVSSRSEEDWIQKLRDRPLRYSRSFPRCQEELCRHQVFLNSLSN
jgi:DNA polymerase-3 subunit epsilon